jgi:hypothetical protein
MGSSSQASQDGKLDIIVTAVGVPGPGTNSRIYSLVSDATDLPIPGALVRVTTDSEGTLTVASGYTNALGFVLFYLDPGTYYLWRSHSDYTFVNPDSREAA